MSDEPANVSRCGWAEGPEMISYHDTEWGVPVHDDRRLFEFLTLEGAQAGLSWLIVLRKRPNYRHAFADFDPKQVARFGPDDVDRLLLDAGLIRHRGKIESTITNAQALLKVQEEHGSFASYLWGFVAGTPVQSRPAAMADLQASSPLSDRLSKDLKARGFRFVGTTICYAFLQAVGLINDHLATCFRGDAVAALDETKNRMESEGTD
jgi:DNA-3-methyladenine glycosylase I